VRRYVFAAITAGVLLLVFSCFYTTKKKTQAEKQQANKPPYSFYVEPGALKGTYLKKLWSAPYEHNRDLKNIYCEKGVCLLETVDKKIVKIDLLDGFPYKHRLQLTSSLQFPPVVYEYPPENQDQKGTEIYLVQRGDLLSCIDAGTLQEYRQEKLGYGLSCPPCPGERNVILCSVGGRVNNLPKEDVPEEKRSKRWTYSADRSISSQPRIKGNKVVFTSEDGYVYSLNTQLGFIPDESWEGKTYARIVTSPVLYKQRVYAASLDENLYAFHEFSDSGTGDLAWKFPFGQKVLTSPNAYKDTIFFIGMDRPDGLKTMYAVKATTGESRWKKQVKGVGDTMYFEHGLKGVDAFLAPGKELVYVMAQNKPEIWGVRIADGEVIHRIPLSGRPDFMVSHDAEHGRRIQALGLIILGTKDGVVLALKEKTVY
jgi:outer membrane protein assembly factor BamB